MKRARVGVVDDHVIFRKALTHLVNQFENCQVILEAGNGLELQQPLNKTALPDILLLDLRMPLMDGFETMEWLHKKYPDLPVIILTMLDTDLTMAKLIRLGVRAILNKSVCEKELCKAIVRVKEDGYYYPDFVSRNLLTAMYKEEEGRRNLKLLLNEKEWKFLKLVSTELTYKQVAKEMNLSVRGIDKIRNSLFEKLNAQSRVVLAIKALRNGIEPAA